MASTQACCTPCGHKCVCDICPVSPAAEGARWDGSACDAGRVLGDAVFDLLPHQRGKIRTGAACCRVSSVLVGEPVAEAVHCHDFIPMSSYEWLREGAGSAEDLFAKGNAFMSKGGFAVADSLPPLPLRIATWQKQKATQQGG